METNEANEERWLSRRCGKGMELPPLTPTEKNDGRAQTGHVHVNSCSHSLRFCPFLDWLCSYVLLPINTDKKYGHGHHHQARLHLGCIGA